MNNERFNEIVEEETARIKSVLMKKQGEYSLDDDRLSHFKHAGAMAGWPPEKALYGYMLKHLMSVTDMVNSGEKFSKDVWQEKMTDIHNYLILLLAVLEDDDMFKRQDTSEITVSPDFWLSDEYKTAGDWISKFLKNGVNDEGQDEQAAKSKRKNKTK